MDEIMYLYVREPGGLRIEVNSGGWINAMPDWVPPEHLPHEGPTTYFRNVQMPDSMMESFPPLEVAREHFTAIGQFGE
jgi:catechol 2,3-dioxygenase